MSLQDMSSVTKYLSGVTKIQLLTAEDEIRLSKMIEAGLMAEKVLESCSDMPDMVKHDLEQVASDGKMAMQKFIVSNLRLVINIAKRYVRPSLPLSDIIQIGNTGLIHAIEKFDYTKGYKFSTYATWWIKQTIRRQIHEYTSAVHLPDKVVEKINKYTSVASDLLLELSREPTHKEISKRVGVDPDEMAHRLMQSGEWVSLDAQVTKEDSSMTVSDVLGLVDESAEFENAIVDDDVICRLRSAIAKLPHKSRIAIEMRFGLRGHEESSFRAIGERIGLSEFCAKGVVVEAIQKIKRSSELKSYAEVS